MKATEKQFPLVISFPPETVCTLTYSLVVLWSCYQKRLFIVTCAGGASLSASVSDSSSETSLSSSLSSSESSHCLCISWGLRGSWTLWGGAGVLLVAEGSFGAALELNKPTVLPVGVTDAPLSFCSSSSSSSSYAGLALANNQQYRLRTTSW